LLQKYSRRRTAFSGNLEHVRILDESLRRNSRRYWDDWRARHARLKVDLRGINLAGRSLQNANFSSARLDGANLRRADLTNACLEKASLVEAALDGAIMRRVRAAGADFSHAHLRNVMIHDGDLRGARFVEAWMQYASLRRADCSGARLRHATMEAVDLTGARFDRADLAQADLQTAILHGTSLLGAKLRDAYIGDASIREVKTDGKTDQRSLTLGAHYVPERRIGPHVLFTEVDDIRLAQFHSAIHEHGSVASLISAATKQVVLILGRFLPGGKRVLDRLAAALQKRGKLPVIFDFPGPEDHEISDTVRFIAGMSQFIVVDMTKASSVPLELQSTIPDLMVPVLPIIERGHEIFAMFSDLQRRYFWVQPTARYTDAKQLVRYVDEGIIARAERAAVAIKERRDAVHVARSITRIQ